MRILALETSGKSGSVAAANGETLIATFQLPDTQRSARSLAPAIHRLLGQVGWQPTDIQLIALTTGPGSFTGLRVGVATAKVLAYATGANVIGIDTLDVIASQAVANRTKLAVALDAQRSQVIAADFLPDHAGDRRRAGESKLLDDDAWLDSLDAETAVTGPALEKLSRRLPAHVAIVEPERWIPQANTVAQLAWRRYQGGEQHDLWSLVPSYMRPSAAEEKLALVVPTPET